MHDMFHLEKGKKGNDLVDEMQVKIKVCDCGVRCLVVQDIFSLWERRRLQPLS